MSDTIATVNFRQPSSRWALWIFAVALLLKAAMPLLATASAHVQGKTLVEVCTVYGVALVPLDGEHQEPAPDSSSAHGGEHCALTALTALLTPELSILDTALVSRGEATALRAHPSSRAPDACATWVARLKHGPPTFS